MANRTTWLGVAAILGCASEAAIDPAAEQRDLPATLEVEPYQTIGVGHRAEVEHWRRFCRSVGDPVVDRDVAPSAGTGAQVAFDERTEELGLPRGVYTSSASAGRLGDRVALFVPGFTNATRTRPGNPYLELFVRCGQRFHPAGLDERLDGFEARQLVESLTSGIWDVDGDGRSDLVLPLVDDAAGLYSIAVLYNEGAGRFEFDRGPRVDYDATLNTVTPVDFNQDGVLDMYASTMGEDFHKAVAGVGDLQARDRIFLFGSNRVWEDVTGLPAGLTGPGDLTTFSFVCVPELPGRRGKLCWVGTGHVSDFILEEKAPMQFEVVASLELPDNATMGVSAHTAPAGRHVTFIATNIGRPLAVRVTADSEARVVSDEIPMQELDIDLPPRTGQERPRVGWGVAYEQFSNTGCPGFVIGNTQINSLSFLPIYEGAGIVYYERNCSPEIPHGTRFTDLSAGAGPLFQDAAISDYFQTLVTHLNDDLCPDLVLTTYPRDPSDVTRLLNDPTELRALVNRCDTPGERVAFQLVPADYGARVVVSLDDGSSRHGYLAQPGQAGTNDQLISMGLGERTPTRACVHWSANSRWPDRPPQCIEAPSTRRINVIYREPN